MRAPRPIVAGTAPKRGPAHNQKGMVAMEHFSRLYRRMNERVSPDPLRKAELFQQAEAAETGGGRKRKRRLRPAAVLAAALTCLVAACVPVCVLAAENPAFNSMLYRLSPELAQFFKPVNLSCEDNGIRLEVESAAVQGDSAQVYLTLRDLTGDRIDGTVDLFDSARIREAYDSVNNCRLVEYDPETKTARFLLSSTTMDGRSIAGNKITFSASRFLSRKQVYQDVEVAVDWTALPEEAPTMEGFCSGGGGTDLGAYEAATEGNRCTVLKPVQPLDWSVKEIDLTAIGFVNGKLHVQTFAEDNLHKDNHGQFWLENPEGDRIDEAYGLYYQPTGTYGPDDRRDFVFDVSREELEGYTLRGEFTTAGLYTEGNWEVTFPVE